MNSSQLLIKQQNQTDEYNSYITAIGPTSPQGLPGSATNTGATGPFGSIGPLRVI